MSELQPSPTARRPPRQCAIAVTGVGLTTSLGEGIECNWERLSRGESGIAPLATVDVGGYPIKVGGEVRTPGPLPPLADGEEAPPELRHLVLVCREALGAPAVDPRDAAPERVGIAVGSSLAASTYSDRFFASRGAGGYRDADYGHLRGYYVDRSLQYLEESLGAGGPCLLVSNACAAGASAVARAADWLRGGRCDLAIAAGFDAFSVFTFSGFGSLLALARERMRPFGAGRDGMHLGGGYAALRLECLERARRAGRRPLALLAGYGESSDAYHLTHPHPEGAGAVRAMRSALALGEVAAEEVDVVNCHATATPSNDASEARALARVFGAALERVAVYAPKPAIGHTLGAAGAVEAVLSVMFLQRQFVPGGAHATELDPALGVTLRFAEPPGPQPLRHVLSNSFGFGGSNTSLLFSTGPEEGA